MQFYPIVNNHFSTGTDTHVSWVRGDFTSATTANGTFQILYENTVPPYVPAHCTAIGTWTASH
jgi:hypothetical protein